MLIASILHAYEGIRTTYSPDNMALYDNPDNIADVMSKTATKSRPNCIGRTSKKCHMGKFESHESYFDSNNKVFRYDPDKKQIWKLLANELRHCILSNGLQYSFYPSARAVDQLAFRISKEVDFRQLAKEYGVKFSVAISFVRLALYDVKLIADDSASMGKDRIAELKEHARKLITLSARFDTDGMDLIMMNYCRPGENNVINFKGQDAGTQFDDFWNQFPQCQTRRHYYITPTGKILNDYVINPLFDNPKAAFNKPVLVYILTDGLPYHGFGDYSGARLLVENVLLNAYKLKEKYDMPQTAIEFSFGQIGDDKDAIDWLNNVDDYPYNGMNVDVNSRFEKESDQILENSIARNEGEVVIDRGQWFAKYILGAIVDELDLLDETKTREQKEVRDSKILPIYSEVAMSDPKMKLNQQNEHQISRTESDHTYRILYKYATAYLDKLDSYDIKTYRTWIPTDLLNAIEEYSQQFNERQRYMDDVELNVENYHPFGITIAEAYVVKK
eukprot:NODE_676_length_4830_cov_0.800676.p2 type:complete len:503 gc:universal NODE_676_length_4830_cov_0.800676:3161-4669(+)